MARHYCGQLGKQDNCQIAFSLSAASEHASLPIAFRLYLPEEWAADAARCAKAGVPEDVVFKTKPQIALDQIHAAQIDGVPAGVVLADAGYGNDSKFRAGLTKMGPACAVGVAPRFARSVGAGGMAVRRSDEKTGALFSYADLEARVRPDHPLRAIRQLANDALAALEGEFSVLYSGLGRPSIPPQRLLRAMLLQAFYSIRSERSTRRIESFLV